MSKYRNVRVRADGYLFDSKAEHRRYCELMVMVKAGEIEALEVHPSYDLCINGWRICKYIADFRYLDRRTGETVIEDVKGVRTGEYKLKARMMRAIHGIDVVEIAA